MDKKIKKNIQYNLLYQTIVVIIPIVLTPYIVRVLGAEALGIYDYCYSYASIVITICMLGIGNYGNREIAYTRDDKQKVTNSFFSILFLELLLGVIALLVFLFIIIFSGEYSYYMSLFLIWIIANTVDCTWFYLGIEEMEYAVKKNIISKLLYVFTTILFVHSAKDLSLYIVLFGASVLFANFAAYKDLKEYINFQFDKKVVLNSIVPNALGAIKMFLPTVATQILLSIDKVVIGICATEIASVSIYSNAEKIIQIPLALVTVVNSVMMPRLANEFSNDNSEQIKHFLLNTFEATLFFAFPLMVGIFTCGAKLIPWYLGAEYLGCVDALKILSPIVIGNVLIGISGNQYFVATNQTGILLIGNLSAAVVNIVLDLVLVPIMGVNGACVATVVALYTNVFIQYRVLRKQIVLRKTIRNIKYFFYSLLMGIIVFLVSRAMIPSIMTTLVQVVVGVVSYFLINIVTGDDLIKKIKKAFL